MKRAILLFVAPFLFVHSYGQSAYEISLANETIHISDRKFYIESVIDHRIERSHIGTIRFGLLDSNHPVLLKDGLSNSLQGYFDHSLPKGNAQIPILIKVNKLKIGQWSTGANEHGYVDLLLEYYYNNDFVFSSKQHIEVTDYDVLQRHEENIREALRRSLLEFNKSEWLSKIDSSAIKTMISVATLNAPMADSTSGRIYFKPTAVYNEITEDENRNVTTIGYQIGGYSLIGFDYEVRFQNILGIHFGAGFRGYTCGLMIHANSKKNSQYFNISFKDGGFGLLHVAGVEYGGRWVFDKQRGFGLTFQIGVVKILKIDEAIRDELFYGEETPRFMSSMGIGLSW
jgi:hypothetical protein